MNAKDLSAEIKKLPDVAEIFVRHGDTWLKIDAVKLLEHADVVEQYVAAEITVSSANWPMFK